MLRVPAPAGDELLALLSHRTLGAWADGNRENFTDLRIYFGTLEEAEEARREATRFLDSAGLDPAQYDLKVRSVPDEHWSERYQAGLRPFPFASRFVVCPSGETPKQAGRIPIRLVPGRAFGTGEHPTTRLCAELLERRIQPGEHWVDLGCGSGILSLVALACGANGILAVDTDPEAIAVAREVFEMNDATTRVVLLEGSTSSVPAGADGIVANILAPFFHEEAPALARLLRPGGTLVASGFDTAQTGEVSESLARAGLPVVERVGLEDWRALACVRQGESSR